MMPKLWCVLLLSAALQAQTLEKEVQAIAAGYGGQVAMAAVHLGTGQSFDLNGDKRVQTASTIKVAVMVEAFYQIQAGKLRLDEPVYLQSSDKVPGSGILQDL